MPGTGWPQWGGSAGKNAVAPQAKNLPVEWDIGDFDAKTGKWQGSSDKKIRWVAKLGSQTYGSPVVADGKVFCATNNAGYLARYPAKTDLGCLVCFDQKTGRFLWQYSAEKLTAGRNVDWPEQGICCSPLVEGKRLWAVTNRGEVVCLDTEGFADGKNDGPVTDEPATGPGEADVLWRFDMMRELGVVQRYMCSCSVTAAGDLLLVNTGNGVDIEEKLPAPKAPSFIALDKNTGKLIWADASPGENILEGQWSSPAFGTLAGQSQALFAGGDGWLYSFSLVPKADRPELLWKFDCNPKDAIWKPGGSGTKNHIIATPVIADGRVYIGTGQDPEAGEGPGVLWCIDPSRRGDVSAELVVDKSGNAVAPRRIQNLDAAAGESVKPNPNSAAVWKYRGRGPASDFKNVMHRTLGMPVIHDGLLVIADFAGLMHCLDAKTGEPIWTHDIMAAVWGGPLVADGKIYVGTEDGDLLVFAFDRKAKLLATNAMGSSIHGSAIVVDNVLYIATRTHLFAIGPEE